MISSVSLTSMRISDDDPEFLEVIPYGDDDVNKKNELPSSIGKK